MKLFDLIISYFRKNTGEPEVDDSKKTQLQLDTDSVEKHQLQMMQHSGTKVRGQHFKQHGCISATFTVLDDIPDELKIGLFSKAANYQAYLRFSNGGKLDDREPDIHGMAIKLLGVDGKKILEGQEDETTHDFVLADNPVFFIRTASDYVPFIEEFSQGKPPQKFAQRRIAANHPEDLKVLENFSKQTLDSPLSGNYWSQVPYALGLGDSQICRYSVVSTRSKPTKEIVEADRNENFLRQAAVNDLSEGGGVSFDFFIQPNDDTSYEVINNPTVEWPDLPSYKVATITVPVQDFNTAEINQFGENLSFTPWHALPEHRPVGEVNEIRKQVYLASSGLRHSNNGVPIEEPSS